MKSLLMSLWLWIAADPERLAFVALASVVAAWKALPAPLRVSLEQRFPRAVGWMRTIVSIAPDVIGALRTAWHQGVKARARVGLDGPAAIEEPARGSIPPSAWPALQAAADARREADERKPSEPGFAVRGVLEVIAGVVMLALGVTLLTGCPLPAPDGCTPFATRCGPSGIPETCSQSQRWSHAPPATPCAQRGPVVCCRTRSPWGRELHACTPQSECLPELASDAGTEVSDAR